MATLLAKPSSASESQALIAERDTSGIRLAIIVFNTVLYLGFMQPVPGRELLALAIVVVALLYGAYVVLMRPYERHAVLRTAWYTLATDSLLITLWVYSTGGITSPFYMLWALSLVAVLFRFGAQVTANATALYMLADLGLLVASGDLVVGNGVAIAARLAYIAVIGALATLVGHRWSEAIEQRAHAEEELAHEHRLAREAENLQVLVDAAFEGIVVHRDGVVLAANPSFSRIADIDARFVQGGRLLDLLPIPADALTSDGMRTVELAREGRSVVLEVRSRDIEFQGMPARLSAIRDITENRRAEEARQLAESRRIEISRLETLERLRTDFINSVAHELNTPLTPLKLQLSMIAEDHDDEAVTMMRRNVDRLARVVSDMLDVTRMQKGHFQLEPRTIDVVPVIQDVAEQFQDAALRKGVPLEILAPERLPAFADPDGIRQALAGFISHAMQASPAGAAVTVIGRDVQAGVRIEVIDNGRGMTDHELETVFQPFGEVHGDPIVPGTGLGLHIAKSIVEKCGGTVGCESDGLGRGSRRWIDLRREPAPFQTPPTQAFKRADGEAPASPESREGRAEGVPDPRDPTTS